MMTNTSSLPLIDRLWPAAGTSRKAVRAAVMLVLGTVLLWAAAKTQVPFWPVPMTLQSMVVVLIGATYGSRLGFATLLVYLAEGAAGLPVFAGAPERGIGLAYMVGPTGGYLLGFLLAATLVGWLVERGATRALPMIALSVLAAHVTIHSFGLAWLSGFTGLGKAVSVGLVPFLLADLLKMGISIAVLTAIELSEAR